MEKIKTVLKEYDIRPKVDLNYNREILYYEDLEIFFRNYKNKFKEADCVACSSKMHFHLIEKDGFHYRQCSECKTVFISPRPDNEALDWWYSASQTKHAMKILEKTKNKRILIYKERIQKLLSRIDSNIKSVLDIGCSSGIFLETFKSINPELNFFGIDSNKDSIMLAKRKKLDCKNITVENFAKITKSRYDLILALEVFEHLTNPVNTLKAISRLLGSSGYLYFTIPNYYGYDFLEIGEIYRNLLGPGHLNYYNPHSIQILLKKNYFKEIKVFCDGILDTSIVENYHHEKKKIQDGFWKYIYDNKNKYSEFLNEFQKMLIKYKLSGNMTIVAKN